MNIGPTRPWPRTMDQLPFDFDNLPSQGCDSPLFPIGYRLNTDDLEPQIDLNCN